jgi:hypothetical protein
MFDGCPLPLPPDLPPIGPFEAWFDLMLGFWLLFFCVLLLLPRKWSSAVLEVAFPFLPPPPR